MKSGAEQLNTEHPKERSMTYSVCMCVNLLIAPSARYLATTQYVLK